MSRQLLLFARYRPKLHGMRSFAVKVGKVVRQTEYASATDLALLRNIGISAHIDSGKTTTTERILYYTGRIDAIHEVKGKDGVGAKMDSMELEREKGITIKSAATHTEWSGHHINIIDTPGHVDFTVEVERSLFVLDGAIFLLCGASGVQSQSLTVDRQMRRYNVPRVCFINKLDRIGANPFRVANQARNELDINAVMMQIPMGVEDEHVGVIDLLEQEALYFDGNDGETIRREPIPDGYKEQAIEYKWKILEALGDVDDDMAMMFLEEEMPSNEELRAAIRKYTIEQKFVPVFMGASFKNKGIQPLLDSVIEYLPSPKDIEQKGFQLDNEGNETEIVFSTDPKAPIVAQAFKLEDTKFGQLTWFKVLQGTMKVGSMIGVSGDLKKSKKVKVSKLCRMHSSELQDINEAKSGDICAVVGIDCYSGTTFTDGRINVKVNPMHIPEPVISMTVKPKNRSEAVKLLKALERFQKEDPTFIVSANEETGQRIFNGMGELHLDIYLERLRREYGVDCEAGRPRVNYRERITASSEYDYLHKKQTGGNGQYAKVIGRIEPLDIDDPIPFQFEQSVTGGALPKQYFKSVEQGFRNFCEKGPLCGAPLIGVKCSLEDGAYHEVDSSDMAFMIAAKGAFRQVFENLQPKIMEPYMNIEVSTPIEFEGGVTQSLMDRQCQLENVDRENKWVTIKAYGPLDQMFGYITSLRSATQGKGEFTMEYREHMDVFPQKQEELIQEYKSKGRGDD